MDQMPFDGVVVTMPNLSSTVLTNTPVSQAQYATALAPMKGAPFQKVKHNFVMVYAGNDPGVLGDWTIPAQNAKNLAAAAKDAGFEGIFYDGERYFGGSWDVPNGCNSTVAICQAAAFDRGSQVGAGFAAGWPGVTVLSTFGPWISDPRTINNVTANYNDVSWANEDHGPFVSGLDVGVNLVDGGELYTERTLSQFQSTSSWQRTLSPGVSVSHGVFDLGYRGVTMDVTQFGPTITLAKQTSDKYAWVYTEQHDWWGTGWPATRVPQTWVDAVRTS
jgi:hypothetical protein